MKTCDQLFELQLAQQRHDEVAHRDILCLAVQDRVKHMVLHFAKYVGHFADFPKVQDQSRFVGSLVDAFIICLASANALNVKLWDQVSDTDDAQIAEFQVSTNTFRALTSELQYVVLLHFAKITGEMAKACESLDHLENFEYRITLEKNIKRIAALSLCVAAVLKLDLAAMVKSRWSEIERKTLFYKDENLASIKNEALRLAAK